MAAFARTRRHYTPRTAVPSSIQPHPLPAPQMSPLILQKKLFPLMEAVIHPLQSP